MKRTETDTGIYNVVELNGTHSEIHAALDGARPYNLEWVLRTERQITLELLAAHGVNWIDKLPANRVAKMSYTEKREWLNRERTEREKAKRQPVTEDAWEVLERIDELLAAIADSTHPAMIFAFRLGRLIERMSLRWAEPLAMIGKKVKGGGKIGGKRTAANPERDEAKKKTRKALKAALADGLPITAAKRRVAKQLGISIRAVHRHTREKSGDR